MPLMICAMGCVHVLVVCAVSAKRERRSMHLKQLLEWQKSTACKGCISISAHLTFGLGNT
eukprot:2188559-Pleurochrysis_carterae.AAC.3